MPMNRIYIRCNHCGEALFLGKDNYSGFYFPRDWFENEHLEDKLERFYDEHCWCDKDPSKVEPYNIKEYPLHSEWNGYGPGDFSLVYESRDDVIEEVQDDS